MPPQKINPASSISPAWCYIDVETTGLNPHVHDVYNVGGIVIDRDGQEHAFDFFGQPHQGTKVSQEALRISNMTMEELHALPPAREAYDKLIAILSDVVNPRDTNDKMWLAGWNIGFDKDFLEQWFLRCDDKYGKYFMAYFWWPPIDIAQEVALCNLTRRHKFENFKMETVARHYGLEVDDTRLHTAYYDAELEYNLYIRATQEEVKYA